MRSLNRCCALLHVPASMASPLSSLALSLALSVWVLLCAGIGDGETQRVGAFLSFGVARGEPWCPSKEFLQVGDPGEAIRKESKNTLSGVYHESRTSMCRQL